MSLVGFDMSGTAVNTLRGLHRLSERAAGITIPPPQFGKHLIGMKFPSSVPGEDPKVFSAEHYEEAKKAFFETEDFNRYAKPMNRLPEALTWLVGRGYRLAMITNARSLPVCTVEQWWQDRELPACDFIFAKQNGDEKAPWLSMCDVVVDDDPDHLVELAVEGRDNLYLMLPEHGTAGASARKRPDDLPERIERVLAARGKTGNAAVLAEKIVSVRGWDEFVKALGLSEKMAA